MSTRVYVPATLDLLADLLASGLPAGGDRFLAEDDSEDAEYAALLAAADASRLLAGEQARRVVVVAEVTDPDGPVALDRVVSVHVDDHDGAGEDDDLAWYATQELPHLLEG